MEEDDNDVFVRILVRHSALPPHGGGLVGDINRECPSPGCGGVVSLNIGVGASISRRDTCSAGEHHVYYTDPPGASPMGLEWERLDRALVPAEPPAASTGRVGREMTGYSPPVVTTAGPFRVPPVQYAPNVPMSISTPVEDGPHRVRFADLRHGRAMGAWSRACPVAGCHHVVTAVVRVGTFELSRTAATACGHAVWFVDEEVPEELRNRYDADLVWEGAPGWMSAAPVTPEVQTPVRIRTLTDPTFRSSITPTRVVYHEQLTPVSPESQYKRECPFDGCQGMLLVRRLDNETMDLSRLDRCTSAGHPVYYADMGGIWADRPIVEYYHPERPAPPAPPKPRGRFAVIFLPRRG